MNKIEFQFIYWKHGIVIQDSMKNLSYTSGNNRYEAQKHHREMYGLKRKTVRYKHPDLHCIERI